MEYQLYGNGAQVKTIRLNKNQNSALFSTEYWANVEQNSYEWIDEDEVNEISVIPLDDSMQRWKLKEGILVAMLSLGRKSMNSDKKTPISPGELLGLGDLLMTLCDLNIDAIRIG
jgi:hypothetical protein